MAADLITRTTSGPREHNAPYPKGRICEAQRNCDGQPLSVYNPGPDCNRCSPPPSLDDHAAIFQRISEMTDPRARRRAFESPGGNGWGGGGVSRERTEE